MNGGQPVVMEDVRVQAPVGSRSHCAGATAFVAKCSHQLIGVRHDRHATTRRSMNLYRRLTQITDHRAAVHTVDDSSGGVIATGRRWRRWRGVRVGGDAATWCARVCATQPAACRRGECARALRAPSRSGRPRETRPPRRRDRGGSRGRGCPSWCVPRHIWARAAPGGIGRGQPTYGGRREVGGGEVCVGGRDATV